MSKIKDIWSNRYVKFGVVGAVYVLWFVVWTQNLWLLLGLLPIYDIYISRFMYRLFWAKHLRLKSENQTYKKGFEWVEAIVFATVVASIIRVFFFEMYVIPTSSMEKTLLVGDYLCVSKVAYGPKMPNTPVSFPFVHHTMPMSTTKKSFSEIVQWPYNRLKGLRSISSGDIVVFNYPAGDTVLLEEQAVNYYDVLRAYKSQFGEKEGRARLNEDYTVISRPVDKRENYIKRLIAMPGETLWIKNSEVSINGKLFREIEGLQYNYMIYTNGTAINPSVLERLGVANDDVRYYSAEQVYMLPLTKEAVAEISKLKNVLKVVKYESAGGREEIFPYTGEWNEDNFGPLWMPAKGSTVALTLENLPLYRTIIETYEGHDLELKGSEIYIDGQLADSYTFAMDYYFMMGDNRHNSADSRYWGFVPEDHIVGTPSFVWLSLDKDKTFPSNIRWDRMFRSPN